MKKILSLLFASIFVGSMTMSLIGCQHNAHTHNFGEWETIKEATCSTSGEQERYCSCGEKQTKSISAKNHDFSTWEIKENATCFSEGYEERYCSCGYSETKTLSIIPCEEISGFCYMCYRTMNPFNALKNYVVTNGSQLSSGYAYLYSDRTLTDSKGVTTYIEYNSNDNEFTIGILMQVSSSISIYTTNVIDMNSTIQKIQMQFKEDGRYHYCSANISTSFCDSNNDMNNYIYRGDYPSMQQDMFEMLNQSTLIMLYYVNSTIKDFNIDVSLAHLGYIYYT